MDEKWMTRTGFNSTCCTSSVNSVELLTVLAGVLAPAQTQKNKKGGDSHEKNTNNVICID